MYGARREWHPVLYLGGGVVVVIFLLIACTCASYLFGFTKSLSTTLQGTSMDVVTACEQIGVIINEIRTIRTRAGAEVDRIFSQSEKMATVARIGEIVMPRIARRQTLRTNVPTEDQSANIYWKRDIFVPYLDGLISQLSDRFNDVSCQAIRGFCLIPNKVNASCIDERSEDTESYFGADMPAPTVEEVLDRSQ